MNVYDVGFFVSLVLLEGIIVSLFILAGIYWFKAFIQDKEFKLKNYKIFDNFFMDDATSLILGFGFFGSIGAIILSYVWFISLPVLLVGGGIYGLAYYLRDKKRLVKRLEAIEKK